MMKGPRTFLCALLALAFIAMDARATTESISIIRQSCSGYSNCYTSLADWQAAKGGITGGNLIVADKIAVAQIEGPWTIPDSKPVDISGWSTDAGHYIKIFTTPEARHKGVAGTGYRLETSSVPSTLFYSTASFIKVEGLEVSSLSAYTGSLLYFRPSSGTGDIEVSYNLLHGNGVNTGSGIQFYAYSGIARVFNNIIYDVATPGYVGAITCGSGSNYIYNNTIGSTISGFGLRCDTPTVAKNNLIKSSGACFYGVFNGGSDFNACAGSSVSGGPHDKKNQSFSFVNETAKDFHLSASDTAARDAGLSLTYDANLPFSDDTDGQTRYGAWDIGADEYSNGSVPSDTVAPSATTNLVLGQVLSNSTSFSWSPSSDNVGVAGYKIFRNGIEYASATGASFSDNAVAPLTDYSYTVAAYDALGNLSAQSAPITVTTSLPFDVTPPHIVILKALSTSAGSVTISWSTDEPSSSQVEYGTSTSYGALTPLDVSFVTSHSVTINPLSSTSYHFRAHSKDSSGNEAISSDLTVTLDPTCGHIYYVDSRNAYAADSNPGTLALPWLTIQHASNTAAPGDTIIVRPGNYSRTRIFKSGLPGYYITFKAESSPDRSHVNTQLAYDPAHPVQYPGNPLLNAVTKGFALYPNYGSSNAIRYIRIENFEITNIYDPASTVASAGAISFNGTSAAPVENIEVVGTFIHDMNPNPQAYDYQAIRSDSLQVRSILIKNNTIFHTQGTGISPVGDDWLVEGNDVSHTLDSNTDTGLEVGGDSDAMRFFGSGHIIRYNYLHDCLESEQVGQPHIDCFQTFSVYPESQFADHILIDSNYCQNTGQMLMSEDSGETSGSGAAIGRPNPIHDITFRNNVFRGAGAYAFHVGIDHFTFVNNVVADSVYGGLAFDSGPSTYATVLNNIFYNNSSGSVFSNFDAMTGSVFDYNMHYPDFTNPSKQPQFDKHGKFGLDPKFLNAAHGDFHLSSDSPAINAGTPWIGYSTDKDGVLRPQGSSWDIGAYEYPTVGPTMPVAPSNLRVVP